MDMELRILPESENELWGKILGSSDHATIFHSWEWLKTAEKYSGTRFIPLIGMRGTEPVCIIPLFVQQTFLQTLVFSPPPHLAIPFLGPVFANFSQLKMHKKESNYIEFRNLLDKFLRTELKADYISIFLPPGLQDPRPFAWAGYDVRPIYDYIIQLDGTTDEIWGQFGKNVRMDINRCEKKGYIVEEGGEKEIHLVHDLMSKRYRQQNKRVKVPEEYLMEIYRIFDKNVKVFTVTYQDRVLTGWIDILYRDELYSWIGNLRPLEKISPSPNDTSSWYGIRFAKNNGARHYITGEAAGNERLHEYYAKFNPDLRIRYSVKRRSLISQFLENIYLGLIKPVRERMDSG
jgi:hypothetical protein